MPQVEFSLGSSRRPLLGGYYRLMTAMVLKAKECGWLEADGSQRPDFSLFAQVSPALQLFCFSQKTYYPDSRCELSIRCIPKLIAFFLDLKDSLAKLSILRSSKEVYYVVRVVSMF